MKTKQKKQFTELSDEDLKLVTGGRDVRPFNSIDINLSTPVLKKCPVICDPGYLLEDCKCVLD